MHLNTIATTAILLITLGAANSAAANQVTLVNSSSSMQPLTITYKIAHKNIGQKVVYQASKKIILASQETISFSLAGYDLAGIVPMEINGHQLPSSAYEFAKPGYCSLATDKSVTSGTLKFTLKEIMPGHGSISCTNDGGVFEE